MTSTGTSCDRNKPFVDEDVAVGSLASMEKGTGARKNAGKPKVDLIPLRVWHSRWVGRATLDVDHNWAMLYDSLVVWQEGDDDALSWLLQVCPHSWIDEAVKVLEFGTEKYAAWNWACGMQWSVCTGWHNPAY